MLGATHHRPNLTSRWSSVLALSLRLSRGHKGKTSAWPPWAWCYPTSTLIPSGSQVGP